MVTYKNQKSDNRILKISTDKILKNRFSKSSLVMLYACDKTGMLRSRFLLEEVFIEQTIFVKGKYMFIKYTNMQENSDFSCIEIEKMTFTSLGLTSVFVGDCKEVKLKHVEVDVK
jgi:hypothetical protein